MLALALAERRASNRTGRASHNVSGSNSEGHGDHPLIPGRRSSPSRSVMPQAIGQPINDGAKHERSGSSELPGRLSRRVSSP
jgi:hypothetical protein